MDIWKATNQWIKAVQERYRDVDRADLTQVFARGPFAGMSERQVLELSNLWKENNKKWPLKNIPED